MREGYERSFVTAMVSPIFSGGEFKSIASKKKYVTPDIENVSADLEVVKVILASEHENKNGDYFSRAELLSAYATPIHKPVDINHAIAEDESYISQPFLNRTQNTIVGHMVYSALAKKDGTVLTEKDLEDIDKTDDPKRAHEDCLDLIAVAVLYSFHFPKTIEDVKRASASNQIFVSMECWFRGYDFIVDGERVERTEANKKELTEKWKKGDKGSDGKRICRALKEVIFGGVGITATPANPESVFLSTASIEDEIEHLKKRHNELHVLQSMCASEDYKKEHDAIEKSISTLMKKMEK